MGHFPATKQQQNQQTKRKIIKIKTFYEEINKQYCSKLSLSSILVFITKRHIEKVLAKKQKHTHEYTVRQEE